MRVINIRSKKSEPEDTLDRIVYIGRPSVLSNPFHIGIHGNRCKVIAEYVKYVKTMVSIGYSPLINAILALNEDSVLACHCKPELCHGDVIVKAYDALKKGLLVVPDHINIYSQSDNELGKLLSNFSNVMLNHPEYGHFYSFEGFYHWLKTGKQFNELRVLSGPYAKKYAKNQKLLKVETEDFQEQICQAHRYRILGNCFLFDLFIRSELPFQHYYLKGTHRIEVPQHQWQVDYLTKLRKTYQEANRTVIFGGRDFDDINKMREAFDVHKVEFVIEGEADGADTLAKVVAEEKNVPYVPYYAYWNQYGKLAGFERNSRMADSAKSAIAFWNGESPGTKDMISQIKSRKIPLTVYNY